MRWTMRESGTLEIGEETMRELERYKVIEAVVDGMLKPWRAAERLGLTTRRIPAAAIRR